jgi:nucleoside-triphosphatase
MKRALLLTGKPGTGKTALIKKALTRTAIRAGGFYTEEIRTGGVREGFRIVTLDGQEAVFAHVSGSGPHQVSKYKVDTSVLDAVDVSALERALQEDDLIVIDEIGKMELLSPEFQKAVKEIIKSGKKLLGTIMFSPHPFADQIKGRPNVEVLSVTKDSQPQVMKRILAWLSGRSFNRNSNPGIPIPDL